MVSLAPIAILVVTQMVRWNGSVASLHYAGMTRPLIIADLPGTLPQDPITLITAG